VKGRPELSASNLTDISSYGLARASDSTYGLARAPMTARAWHNGVGIENDVRLADEDLGVVDERVRRDLQVERRGSLANASRGVIV